MLFFGIQDLHEQLAAHVVAHGVGIRHRIAQGDHSVALQRQIALQDLGRVLTDAQLAQRLEVRQAFEEQDAIGEHVGMLHLLDRFLVLVFGQFLDAPVLQHLGVQEVLVDRGQLVVEDLVEEFDDLGVALHGDAPAR
ncbi:hypothetical protein D3C72_1029050 [compost metagenome]